MVEQKPDKATGTNPTADDAQKESAITPALPQKISKGEIWYNRIVYSCLNYWANLGISLVVTDYFMHGWGKGRIGNWGKGFFSSTVENWANRISKTGIEKSSAHWIAEQASGTFSLNSGGNILLIPTKFLEDNKRSIVHWLNKKMGVDQTAPDGHEMTPDEIYLEKEQPKQSWPRMIGRRLLAWGATTATGMGIDKMLAQPGKSGQKVFTDATVNGANYVLNAVPGGSIITENPLARRYMGYAALDWIYTIITSKVLHLTNGAKKQETLDNKSTPPAPLPSPAEATPACIAPGDGCFTDKAKKSEPLKPKKESFVAELATQDVNTLGLSA